MYSYLICGSAAIVLAGTGMWVYQNLPQVLIAAINLYVDLKYAIRPDEVDEENPPSPKVEPTALFETKHFTFAIYGNYVSWGNLNEIPAPPTGNLSGNHCITIVRGTDNLNPIQTKELVDALGQFAGPSGDFGGRPPTTDVLSEWGSRAPTAGLNFEIQPLLIMNEFMEEFMIKD